MSQHAIGLGAFIAGLAAFAVAATAQEGEVKSVAVDNARDMRFCEILIVKPEGIDVYNTTGVSDCPANLWDSLDIDAIKTQYGAQAVQKNGPHFWMMDSQTFAAGEDATFGGIAARWVARLDPKIVAGASSGSVPYKVFNPKKTQKMVYAQGRPVYELVDPDGNVFVLQAHEEQFPIDSLATLGDDLKLPEGWQFRTQVLEADLIMNLTPDMQISAVGDEYHQYWTQIPRGQ
jgi:hypothetical protein